MSETKKIDPEEFEKKHVHDVYKAISSAFDESRKNIWKNVGEFIKSLPENAIIADIGCGNGKYIKMRPKQFVGCDMNEKFVDICKGLGYNVKVGSILKIPFDDASVDHTICVAVLHHLSTEERRIDAIKELIRITKPKGQIMIQVWAQEQESGSRFDFKEQDVMVPWNNKEERFYHVFKKGELEQLVKMANDKVTIVKSFYERGNWSIIIQNNS